MSPARLSLRDTCNVQCDRLEAENKSKIKDTCEKSYPHGNLAQQQSGLAVCQECSLQSKDCGGHMISLQRHLDWRPDSDVWLQHWKSRSLQLGRCHLAGELSLLILSCHDCRSLSMLDWPLDLMLHLHVLSL